MTSDSGARQRQLDVQVIMAADKEHVLSQKRASASWGVEIPVGYSEVISSKSYAGDFEARRAGGRGEGVCMASHMHTPRFFKAAAAAAAAPAITHLFHLSHHLLQTRTTHVPPQI